MEDQMEPSILVVSGKLTDFRGSFLSDQNNISGANYNNLLKGARFVV